MFAYPNIKPDVFNPREVYEAKLLIAHFLNRIDRLCTPDQLLDIATGDGIIDYFLYCETINQMLNSGMLQEREIEGEVYYELTEDGKQGADDFKRIIPKSVRDRFFDSGLRVFSQQKNERLTKVEISKGEQGWNVDCTLTDSGVRLMRLNMLADSEDLADYMKYSMIEDPSTLYSMVIDPLLGVEENTECDERSLDVSISDFGTECEVACDFIKDEKKLMSLSLFAPDHEQAELIGRAMSKGLDNIYKSVFELLTR